MRDSHDAESWRRIDALFAAALEHPPEERPRFLEEACGEDLELRRAVEELLAASGEAGELFDLPEGGKEPLLGRRIDAFQVLEVIGRGGMGTVYLAERADGQYRQRVALKLLRRGLFGEEAARRFRLERQILARLQHPSIGRLLGGGVTEEGQPYFVMEHVLGSPITDYCDRHQLGLEQRLELFRTVCAAVQYAHQNLVVHRDLKPGNILVTEDGQVKLLDFGIARVLDAEAFDQSVAMTQAGARLMTPDYAAPEQVRGEAITTATDVYALGMLLYELLTGRRPYSLSGRTLQEVERIVCEQAPPRPSAAVTTRLDAAAEVEARSRARRLSPEQLRRRLSGDLDNIVLLALRKEPERRYRSVEQLSEDTRRHLRSLPVQARGDTLLYRAGKFTRRHTVGLAASALVVLALVGGLTATAYQAGVANQERERNERLKTLVQEMVSSPDPLRSGREVTLFDELDRALGLAERVPPEIEADVRSNLGRSYQVLRMHGEAEPHLRRALELLRNRYGEQHREVAVSRRGLAELLHEQGDHAGADSLYQGALTLQRHLFGPSHPEVAITLKRLGQLRHAQGDYPAAAAFFEQSLAMRRQLLGEGHPEVADGLNDLGLLRYDQGDFAAADSLSRRALAINQRLYGPENLYVAFSLTNLGRALQARGRLDEAEELFEQTLVLRQKRLGEAHPLLATTLDDLARIAQERQDYERAESRYRQALTLRRRRLLEEERPYLAWSLQNLAALLEEKGDYAGAEPLYREALDRDRRLLGGEHPEVAVSLHKLAGFLHRSGRYQEADTLYRQALDLDRRYRTDPHPIRAYHLASWAGLLGDLGRSAEAEALFGEALDGLRATVTADSPFAVEAQRRWGEFLVKQGRSAEAEPVLREALVRTEARYGADHHRTLESRIWLGRCLTALGRYDEAEALLQQSYRAARAQPARSREYTRQAAGALVELYTRSNRPREAAAYRVLQNG